MGFEKIKRIKVFGFKNNHRKNLSNFMLEFCKDISSNNYAVDCSIAESFFYNQNNYIQHYRSGKQLENSISFPDYTSLTPFKHVGCIDNINEYYNNLEIDKKYNFKYNLKNNDIFYYGPWKSNCILNWYTENDFIIKPLDSKLSNCSLKTLNGDGSKLRNIGTCINVLWDNNSYKEAFLYDNDTIIIIHNNIKYNFTRVLN